MTTNAIVISRGLTAASIEQKSADAIAEAIVILLTALVAGLYIGLAVFIN